MGNQFKTAWKSIRRSPFQAMSAILVLSITFFVISTLAVLTYSSDKILQYFETRPQVIAFLKSDAADADINALSDKLKVDSRVSKVTFVSKEQALEIYKKATEENPLLSELVSPSIFPPSIELSLTDLSFAQEVITDIKKYPVIDQVGFTASLGGEKTLDDVISRLRKVTFYLRAGGAAFAILLASTSFLVLMIIIGMRMTARRGEIEILELIGATPGFIRSPIIIEAILYSVIGVFMGWFVSLLLTLYTTPTLVSYFKDIPILPKDTMSLLLLFLVLFAVEILIGFILSLTGSFLAVSRAKSKKKR
ncbi:MAG: hypothetical protein ACD_50C00027G0002 [uncultured bacterium]|nr:MAG: hypothetical protein ACD_50C00027G0002 [uncultured bacterium]